VRLVVGDEWHTCAALHRAWRRTLTATPLSSRGGVPGLRGRAYVADVVALETDYLVVGAGAVGMSFADTLVAHSDADVLLVDRRHRPGGHWNDAYPWVRLHIPSANYGVDSVRLGDDAVDERGPNAGMYELASASELCAYYTRVLDDVLLPSGQVRFLAMHEYERPPAGGHRLLSRLSGETVEVRVRRRLVDATYLAGEVPSRHVPSFAVAPGVRFVPINGLVELEQPASHFVVLGAGKTGIDACLWLLDHDVEPDRITWVRPRDMWMYNRAMLQPLDQVASIVEGTSLELEALAGAESIEDLFRRLEERSQLLRIDPAVEPTMFRCATVSTRELQQLRGIRDVVRLGHVLRIERDRLVLEGGSVPAGDETVHVDCTAQGVPTPPARAAFEPARLTIQPIRICLPTFNAALIAYVEATREDDAAKNRLCPPNPYPDTALDWVRCTAVSMAADELWSAEPDLDDWLERSRLNLVRGLRGHAAEPRMVRAFERIGANADQAGAALRRLQAQVEGLPQQRRAQQRGAAAARTPTGR
jgi:hypothetical protein